METLFCGLAIGDAPDALALLILVEEDLQRCVSAEGRFVDDIDEDFARASTLTHHIPIFATGASPFC
ncbi:MAG: hypothetical protein WC804_21585 [Sphingomonas sp.]